MKNLTFHILVCSSEIVQDRDSYSGTRESKPLSICYTPGLRVWRALMLGFSRVPELTVGYHILPSHSLVIEWMTVKTSNPTINFLLAGRSTASTRVRVDLMWLNIYTNTETAITASGGVALNCCPRIVNAETDMSLDCFVCQAVNVSLSVHVIRNSTWLTGLTNKWTTSFLFVDCSSPDCLVVLSNKCKPSATPYFCLFVQHQLEVNYVTVINMHWASWHNTISTN